MFSDREQCVPEELERSLSTGPPGTAWNGRPLLLPGLLAVAALGCLSVVLLIAGVAADAFALVTATAIGWLFWRMWAHRGDGSESQAGKSIRRHLRWLAEAA